MTTSDIFKRKTYNYYDMDINCPCCSWYRKISGTRKNTKPLLRRLVRRNLRLKVKEEAEELLIADEGIAEEDKQD